MTFVEAVSYSLGALALCIWGLIEGIPAWRDILHSKKSPGYLFAWLGIPISIVSFIALIYIWVWYFKRS